MEQREHHKRELLFLIGFLIMFLIIFVIAFLNLKRGVPVFGISGLPYIVEDMIIIVLSFIAIIKVVWHIIFY